MPYRSVVEPIVSVVICTHNRERLLPAAIESVLGQASATPTELIVVDNGSTDGTRAAVERYQASAPIRYVFAPTLGLSHARNAGWQAARGRWVAYLDDDAVAGAGWLESIRLAFEHCPEAGMVGGRVDPIWEAPRPSWVSDRLARVLSIVDWSPVPLLLRDPATRWLAGANMAVRRDLLARVGGFSPALGRRGGTLLSGEETLLQYQLLEAGYPSLYFPSMGVRHLIPVSRLRRSWFLRRYFWQGVSDAWMSAFESSGTSPLLAAHAGRSKARFLKRLARVPSRLGTALFPTVDPARFTEQCLVWVEVGRIAGAIRPRQLR